MEKLITTEKEMLNVTKKVKQYTIIFHIPGYTDSCHNDRWEVPGRDESYSVTKFTYDHYKGKKHISECNERVSFEEFALSWKAACEERLVTFGKTPNLENVKSAIFAVKQYDCILDVKLNRVNVFNQKLNEVLIHTIQSEKDGLKLLLDELEVELKVCQAQARKEKRLLNKKKKEAELKKKEAELQQAKILAEKEEKERAEKIAQMEAELKALKK